MATSQIQRRRTQNYSTISADLHNIFTSQRSNEGIQPRDGETPGKPRPKTREEELLSEMGTWIGQGGKGKGGK